MKEIRSFEVELNHARELGHEVAADDSNKLAELVDSQLNSLDDSYQMLQAGAQATYVCITLDLVIMPGVNYSVVLLL